MPNSWVSEARRYIAAHRALDEIEFGRASDRAGPRPLIAAETGLASDSRDANLPRIAQHIFRRATAKLCKQAESWGAVKA